MKHIRHNNQAIFLFECDIKCFFCQKLCQNWELLSNNDGHRTIIEMGIIHCSRHGEFSHFVKHHNGGWLDFSTYLGTDIPFFLEISTFAPNSCLNANYSLIKPYIYIYIYVYIYLYLYFASEIRIFWCAHLFHLDLDFGGGCSGPNRAERGGRFFPQQF